MTDFRQYPMHIFIACLLLLVSLSAAAEDKSSQLDRLMQQYHDLEHFNGTALVVGNGSEILRKGYGLANFDWRVANTPETRFAIGSVSKSFTALVVLQLAELGALDLDATISEYLPKYRMDTGSVVTIRQLLTHTDGIPNYTSDASFRQSYENGVPYPTSEFIARYCSGDTEFTPGSQYRYGNAGFSILGAIVEKVTGETFGDAVAHQILQPLHMQDSGQLRKDLVIDNRATGYEVSLDGYRPAAPIYKPFFAASNMYTTVDDLVLYDRALSGESPISEFARNALFESREGAVEGTFAYGWSVGESNLDGDIEARRYVATNGEINGFNATMVRIPDDNHLIILLNNTGETDLSAMAENILRVLYDLMPKDVDRRLRDVFYRMLQQESLDAAIEFYREQREKSPRDYLYFPWPLRILTGQLINDGRYDDAISILELNLETNPQDAKSIEMLAAAIQKRTLR
jgi:CubicO group peptidase (beta-lactamase class C family)